MFLLPKYNLQTLATHDYLLLATTLFKDTFNSTNKRSQVKTSNSINNNNHFYYNTVPDYYY